MQPEIFTGKKGKNNELILKALYEKGYLTPWKIAKEIAIKDLRKKPKANLYHKMQKINSVLVRRNGRLTDLVNNEFVERTDKGYCLTFNKGFCSALYLYEKKIPSPAIDEATKIDAIIPEFKEILGIISKHHPEAISETYVEMREITKKLLDKGLNFEKISNRDFNNFFAGQYQESYLNGLKKKDDNQKRWDPPPELKEATQKLLSRLMVMVQRQVKELEDLQSNYCKNSPEAKNE